jgi:multidrug efflux pump
VFSRFFIDRPIFASVLSIVITLTGGVALTTLPVAQYPQIVPPSIIVQARYPGASAEVVAESVAAPIEQSVNGVEDMIYMASQSSNDGFYSLTVTFRPGVDLNFAQVLVQNRVNLAMAQLPDVVKQAGVSTRRRNPDILQIVCIYSPKGRYDQLYLNNFATIQVRDELARVDGIGDVSLFGAQDYAMRVWVEPDRLGSMGITAGDVVDAVRAQNLQVAAGHFGQRPNRGDRPNDFTITTLGRLTTPEDFENIILRSTPDGRKVYIKDVGHVTLGARSEDISCKLDGIPCTNVAVFQSPYSNANDAARRVREKMKELKESFPEDIEYDIAYDTTPYISESIREVFHTLLASVVLVAVVVLVFLQNWRSALIPLIAVPVAVIGTFAAMAAIHFSINNLTLFGLVLAIGIVVDDAIVVVEAIEHHIEEGMAPRQAAYRAMEEVSGPVMAVALVLSAVFVPCAFISGITGQFFRQFALTIAVSTIISAFNSLTLSPALAAILLQPTDARKDWFGRFVDHALGWFFTGFNWCYAHVSEGYLRVVARAVRGTSIVLLVYTGLVVLTWWGSRHLPTGYIPVQDLGKMYAVIQLPDSASLERTVEVVDRVAALARETRGVKHTIAISGQSFTLSANGSNFGNIFMSLDEFDDRRTPDLYYEAIAVELRKKVAAENLGAVVTIIGPPPVQGLGNSGGFKIVIEDRSGDNDLKKLQEETNRLIDAARPPPPEKGILTVGLETVGGFKIVIEDRSGDNDLKKLQGETNRLIDAARVHSGETLHSGEPKTRGEPKISKLFTVFRADSPQLYVDLNREQCQNMGVNPRDVFTTLQVYLGSLYINEFNEFGRSWEVIVQAEGPHRDDVDKVKRLKVRNKNGDMIPLGAVLSVREINGPLILTRYNMYPAAIVLGATQPGVSSGQGIEAMERLCKRNLPPSMAYEWTEINFIQVDAAKNIWNNLIFPLAVLFVFLVLAAQYESWALPLAVILVVPMCILGSLIGVYVTHSDINIFTQIGFVVLVGLASKNAILIVEFAKHKKESGLSRKEATLQACRLRLRPILMTSFAFILGVVPLMVATGAGAEMRRTLGTAVFSGMLGVTLFGIFLTPVFFAVIEWFIDTPVLREMRFASKIALFIAAVFALGFFWWLVVMYGTPADMRYGKTAIFFGGLLGLVGMWLVIWAIGRVTRQPIPLLPLPSRRAPAVPKAETSAQTHGDAVKPDEHIQVRQD